MIVFFSELSPTVLQILNWLNLYSKQFVLIDNRNCHLWGLDVDNLLLKSIAFVSNDGVMRLLNVEKIDSYMIFHGNIVYPNINNGKDTDLYDYHTNLIDEIETVKIFVEQNLLSKAHIGSFNYQNVNKLSVLNIAKVLEIDIPATFVLTEKKHLKRLIKDGHRLITKALANPIVKKNEDQTNIAYSSIIEMEDIVELGDTFFPSLFQHYVEKEFELRVVFLNGIFFSSVIVSQNNEQTKVDYRRYDFANPNRVIPYKLPDSIEMKLTLLMKKLNLNFGSIDMIYSTEGKYVFLEVNPVGQFGFVSSECNYQIEKHIADFLSN